MPRGRNWVTGEQLAQVDNRDPFAVPVWRSPVYRTPEPVIMVVQLVRLICRVLWFVLTHPAIDAVAALVIVSWLGLSWPGVAGLAAVALTGLTGLRVLQPVWFARFVAVPVRDWLRWWFYRRRWKAAMTLAGLAPDYRGQPMLPVLDRVHRAGAVDLVRVGLVTGQAPTDFEARAENLAHAFGARLCRIRGAAPGVVTLELVRADTLADPIPALPVTGEVDLAGLPVGRREDGSPWQLRIALGRLALSGQLYLRIFMLRAAGSGTRRGLLAESCNRVPSGDACNYSGSRCTGQCPPVLSFASGTRSGAPARPSPPR